MSGFPFPEAANDPAARARLSTRRRVLGLCLLAVAVGAAGLLVLEHFGTTGLPGCGADSDCARAAASRWGKIAAWPTSFFGLAYFVALAAAWSAAPRDGISAGFIRLARLGAAASAFYLGIMLVEQLYCVYCLTAHVANLAFWLTVERSPAAIAPDGRFAFAAGGAFALSMAVLNVLDAEHRWTQESAAEARAQDAIRRIRASRDDSPNRGDAAAPAEAPVVLAAAGTPDLPVETRHGDDAPSGAASYPHHRIEGRYPLGATEARARLVLFYDYQCEHCQGLDRELKALLQQYASTLSVSIRHYPLCTDCNYLFTTNTHPNACRAARAAEAAGLLQGADGFWRFHDWLIQRKGDFTDHQLRAGLVELGYESPDTFLEVMHGERARRRVLEDIIEAESRRVERTPTVFVNGVLLEGWQADRALARAIAAAVEESPAAKPATVQTGDPDGGLPAATRRRSLAATVRIVSATRSAQASGVIAGQDGPFFYVLTARHVVPPGDRLEVHTFDETTDSRTPRVYKQVEVIARADGSDDLAIVRVLATAERVSFLPICPPDLVPESDGLAAVSVGCSRGAAPTVLVHAGTATRLVQRHAGERETLTWETVEPAVPGRSGGPLIDERGYVIGIQSGSAGASAYYSHTSSIHRLLAGHGLNWLVR